MKRPSVTMPEWMTDEIEARRPKGVSRSEYIRDSLKRRFEQEDEGTWNSPSDDAEPREQPAD